MLSANLKLFAWDHRGINVNYKKFQKVILEVNGITEKQSKIIKILSLISNHGPARCASILVEESERCVAKYLSLSSRDAQQSNEINILVLMFAFFKSI